jgi:two-component system OmpR family response regulator
VTLTHPHVLVVDDSPLVLELLVLFLSSQGFRVTPAGGGGEALDAFRRGGADVALLDVQMPGLDGVQLLALLCGVDPAVRCVFMTGRSAHYSHADLLRAGASSVVEKPFDNLHLARTLRAAAGPPEG